MSDEEGLPNWACGNCGEVRFRIEPAMFDNGTFVGGTVIVNSEWSVVGWGGILLCSNCGTELPNPELDAIGRMEFP